MAVAYYSFYKNRVPKLNEEYSAGSSLAVLESGFSNVLLRLVVSCTNLPQTDPASPVNSIVVLFVPVNETYQEVSRTEAILNNPNPFFCQIFPDYVFV